MKKSKSKTPDPCALNADKDFARGFAARIGTSEAHNVEPTSVLVVGPNGWSLVTAKGTARGDLDQAIAQAKRACARRCSRRLARGEQYDVIATADPETRVDGMGRLISRWENCLQRLGGQGDFMQLHGEPRLTPNQAKDAVTKLAKRNILAWIVKDYVPEGGSTPMLAVAVDAKHGAGVADKLRALDGTRSADFPPGARIYF